MAERKEVRTYIDVDLRQEWESRFKYASLSWLMETAMRETLDLVKEDPTLEEQIKAAIHAHILKYQPQRANVSIATIP